MESYPPAGSILGEGEPNRIKTKLGSLAAAQQRVEHGPCALMVMLRVALIAGTYRPDRCGVADYTAHLRTALPEVDFTLLTTQSAAAAIADPQVLGVVEHWRLQDLWPLVRTIWATQADLLHLQHAAGTYGFERAIFLLPLWLRLTGWRNPIVTTVHEYGWWEWQPQAIPPQLLEGLKQWGQHRGWWDREDGFLLTLSDALITTNPEVEQAILHRLPALRDRLHFIPLAANIEVAPIDRATARRQLRHACHWPEDAVVFAFFGFLHPTKGLETLLTAFEAIAATQPQMYLLLVGGVESLALQGNQATDYWHHLKNLVQTLQLDGRVQLTGYLPATTSSHYLTGADLGVLPFHHGVTLKSGSLLALLAHGLPVVATRSRQADPVLMEAGGVAWVPPRDRDALAIALLDLWHNPQRQTQLRQQGQAFVQQLTWEAIAQAHRQLYGSLVRGQANF